MIYGSTVSYRSTAAGNFASLASYLQADIWALRRKGTGHAVNPVPVTENERIPDVDEIIDAQIFAGRLAEHAATSAELIDPALVDDLAAKLVEGGRAFARNVLEGLPELGVDRTDAGQIMLALRRIGPKRLERLFGAGPQDAAEWSGRRTIVSSEWMSELEHLADRLHRLDRRRAAEPHRLSAARRVRRHERRPRARQDPRREGARPVGRGGHRWRGIE